jgi:hypothetical protein
MGSVTTTLGPGGNRQLLDFRGDNASRLEKTAGFSTQISGLAATALQ